MWKITGLDYEAPLFTNAEAREGAGVSESLWAKWKERYFGSPTRNLKGGRGGQYAAKKIFELRSMYLVQQMGIPISEAMEIAALAAKGPWKIEDLTVTPPPNWRSYVLRERPRPLDIFLIFSKTDDCWGYDFSLGSPGNEEFKQNASLVLGAARELIRVSQYCWGLLHGSEHEATKR